MLNKISAKEIELFGGKSLAVHIDDIPMGELLSRFTGNNLYKDLCCAWLLNDLEVTSFRRGESRYIWTLLREKRNCNIPILICPDDMDFWCTVIVVQVKFLESKVIWNRFGSFTEKIDLAKLRASGIQDLLTWSDEDWEKYGSKLSMLDPFDEAWEQWWKENWQDEENRRLWNYFHLRFNDNEKISWLKCPSFTFDLDEYNTCVSAFEYYPDTKRSDG